MTPEEARTELARMARSKKLRIIEWTRARPCEWRPTEVYNPASGLPFTDVRAWEYIAELLDAGHYLDVIDLTQPSGEVAYVMTVQLEPERTVYIKLQFLRGRVLGRSFHYSDR